VSIRVAWICSKIFKIMKRNCLRQCVNQICLSLQQNLQNHEEKLPKAVCQSVLLESAAKSSKSRRETAQSSVSIRAAWICSKILKSVEKSGGTAPARRTRCLHKICWCLVDCILLTSNV
jgi:hypothetical protein